MLSPIESFVRGSITSGKIGLKCFGRSFSHGDKRAPSVRPRALSSTQRAIGVGIDERHVADRVRAARDAGVDEARGDLAADDDRGRQARAAGALDVECRRLGREPRRQRGLAREVEVARVLDDGAERHVAQALAGERIACDERLQHRRHHVLVRAAGVRRVRAAKRNANCRRSRRPDEPRDCACGAPLNASEPV